MEQRNATNMKHTPASLMAVFAEAFKIDPKENIYLLQGIYQDRKRGSYSGFYFDRLQDAFGGQIITVKVPEKLKQQIADGGFYCFKGILDKDIRWDGVIEPVFLVTTVEQQVNDQSPSGIDIRMKLLQEKKANGFKNVETRLQKSISQNKQPKIALICGKTSIVLQDVFSALKEAGNNYAFTEQRINLLDRQAIIRTLAEVGDKFDVVAIIRGGGPGLEIFDDVGISEASLQLEPILVTAIGHAQDDTLLQQIADQQFATPTSFGTFLRETAVASQHQSKPQLAKPDRIPPTNRFVLWSLFALIMLILGILLGMALITGMTFY